MTSRQFEQAIIEPIGNRTLIYIPGYSPPFLIHSALLPITSLKEANWIESLSRLFGVSVSDLNLSEHEPVPAVAPDSWDDPHHIDGLGIFVTDRCNLSCTYCLAREKKKSSKELDASQMLNICRPYISGPHPTTVTLSGGEPLMRPKVVTDLTEGLRRKEFNVGRIKLITNLTLMDNKIADVLKKCDVDISTSIHASSVLEERWWENQAIARGLHTLKNTSFSNVSLVFVIDSRRALKRFIETPMGILRHFTGEVLISPDLTRWPDSLDPHQTAFQFIELREKARSYGLHLTGWWEKPMSTILDGNNHKFAWCPGISGGSIVVWPDGRLSRCKYLFPSDFYGDGVIKRNTSHPEDTCEKIHWERVDAKKLHEVATEGCNDCWLLDVCAGGCSFWWPERKKGDYRRCTFLRTITRGLLVERARRAIIRKEIKEAIEPLRSEFL